MLVQSTRLQSGAPAFHAAVDDVVASLARTPGVIKLQTPYGGGGRISRDGHTALISFEVRGGVKDVATKRTVDATLAAVQAAGAAHPRLRVEQFGDVSSERAFDKVIQSDLHKAEISSLPLTLVILLVAFGTLLAAGIPVVLAISAVVATFGLVGPLSQIAPVDDSIKNVILLIGLAVGVDYSLFYVRRVREERAAGREGNAAIEAAAATSGRAVLVSGVTVMISMAGMYLAGAATFTSFATGTIAVVAVAMLGSLTVLPAVLSKVGARIDGGRIPGSRPPQSADAARSVRGRGSSIAYCGGHCCRPPSRPGCSSPSRCRRSACKPDSQDGLAAEEHAGRADIRAPAGRLPKRDLGHGRRPSGHGRHRARRPAWDRKVRTGRGATARPVPGERTRRSM